MTVLTLFHILGPVLELSGMACGGARRSGQPCGVTSAPGESGALGANTKCSLSIPVLQTHVIPTYPTHHPPFCCSYGPKHSCFVSCLTLFLTVRSSRTTLAPTRPREKYSLSLVADSEAFSPERSIFFLNIAVDMKCWNSGNVSGGPQKWKGFAYMLHIAREEHWRKPRGPDSCLHFPMHAGFHETQTVLTEKGDARYNKHVFDALRLFMRSRTPRQVLIYRAVWD